MTALRDPVSTQGEVCTGIADVLTQTYTTVFTSDCACDARPPKKEINILSPVLHTEGLKGKHRRSRVFSVPPKPPPLHTVWDRQVSCLKPGGGDLSRAGT